jgi:hypothetical protein
LFSAPTIEGRDDVIAALEEQFEIPARITSVSLPDMDNLRVPRV